VAQSSAVKLAVTEPSSRALEAYVGRRVIMGLRPEHLMLGDGVVSRSFAAKVEVVEQLGSEILLETRVGDARVTAARVPPESAIAAGDQVRLSVQPGRLHFFDPDTENAITA
jgi:ABC-type sugar transport systems, ATPase components